MSIDINDYGIIGDMRTCALISDRASIDWLCFPRFDSAAVFLRLLDDESGGFCDIEVEDFTSAERRYQPLTNILETTLNSRSGSLLVIDFFSVRQANDVPVDSDSDLQIIRMFRCTTGRVHFKIKAKATFDYARHGNRALNIDSGIVFESLGNAERKMAMQWSSTIKKMPDSIQQKVDLAPDEVHLSVTMRAEELSWLSLKNLGGNEQPEILTDEVMIQRHQQTTDYWLEWSSRFNYTGRWKEQMQRSVLCLKLLTYAPTGAIVAAPTCGLPEVIGGERNWDYRFCWLRDASFTVSAFINCGYQHEAQRFLAFLQRADTTQGKKLKVLYPIVERETKEQKLTHLHGWKNSRPVNIGNGASDQVQLDIFGEYLCAIESYLKATTADEIDRMSLDVQHILLNVLRCVQEQWNERDQGLWELRLEPKHYLHSKGMCWLAIEKACSIAQILRMPFDETPWRKLQEKIRADYMERGWNEESQALMQTYDLERLDASAMRLVLYGALDMKEDRMRRSFLAIEKDLCDDDLVYRFLGDDGLPGKEGCFTSCSFWLASMYAYTGEAEKSLGIFNRMLSRANDLGLFSEEMLPGTFEQIGNFPQAFTHMAVINNGQRILQLLGQN